MSSIAIDSVTIPATGPVSFSKLQESFNWTTVTGEVNLMYYAAWYYAYTYMESNTTSWAAGQFSLSSFKGLSGPKLNASYPIVHREVGLPGAITTQIRYNLATDLSYRVETTRFNYLFTSNASWGAVSLRNNASDSKAIDLARYGRLRARGRSTRLATALKEAKIRGANIYLDVDIRNAVSARYSGTLQHEGLPQSYTITVDINDDGGRDNTLFWTRSTHGRVTRSFDITDIINTSTITTIDANVWFNAFDESGTFSSGYVTVHGINFRVA